MHIELPPEPGHAPKPHRTDDQHEHVRVDQPKIYVASLSDYKTYGWYSDDYLLVSKNSSELYIMAKTGSKDPIKISDYHNPALTYVGYGGGYGGL